MLGATTDIPGLPAFSDSLPTEYNKVLLEGRLVTEVEYVIAGPVAEMSELYGSAFDQEGWRVTDQAEVDGERTYSVTLADRHASVRIDRVRGATHVRIELNEPATLRDATSDR